MRLTNIAGRRLRSTDWKSSLKVFNDYDNNYVMNPNHKWLFLYTPLFMYIVSNKSPQSARWDGGGGGRGGHLY